MAAYATLVSILTIIDQIQNHPRLSISFNMNQLKSLGEKVGFLLDFIETDTHGVIREQAQVLERRIASAAYAAEDVIESHVVDQIQPAGSVEGHRLRKVVKDIMHSMRLKKATKEENHAGSISMLDLQKVIEDMDSIKKKVMEFKDESGSNDDMQPTSTTTSSSTPLITTGKNTMVGFDEQLIQLLDKLTGQRSNRQVIPIVGMGGIGKTTLAQNAYEHSLIVHHFDIRTWVTISQKYSVKELLLQLLSMISSDIDSEDDEQLLGQKLHKILWGRRYLIVIDDIWGIEAWDKELTSFLNSREDENCSNILSLRFIKSNESQSLEEIARGYVNDLIDRNLILKHTMGSNGNVKNCMIHDLLRDLCLMVAQKEEFICVIEDIARGTERGRRIVCDKKIQQVKYPFPVFYTLRLAPLTGTWVTNIDGRPFRVLHTLRLAPLTRTWVTSIDGRISNNRLLRVMSFNSEAKIKYLRRHIVDQVNMRYLAYTNFMIPSLAVMLPSSIDIVWNLQTLIIRGRIIAPSQIWEMRQLRHVDIWELYLSDPPPQSGDQHPDDFVLPNLQTLKNVRNFVWSEEVCKGIVNVRKLIIAYGSEWKKSNKDYQLYNVSQLHKLESLSCVSYCKDETLRKLTFPCSLKKLSLDGFMVRYQDLTVIGSLPCLEVLKLLDSSIKEDEWNPIEGEFLRLKFLLVLWSSLVYWNVESSHFPVLEKLVLLHMKELDGIPLDVGEIPTLRLIELKSCNESTIMSAFKIAEEQEDAGNELLQVRVEFLSEYLLERFQEKMKQTADHNFTRNNFHVVTKKYGPIGS
ncbi:hypothetical protein ACP275_04G159400 [Erythranthe tilingii]